MCGFDVLMRTFMVKEGGWRNIGMPFKKSRYGVGTMRKITQTGIL